MTASPPKPRSLGITLLVLLVAGLAFLADRQGWIDLGSGRKANSSSGQADSRSEAPAATASDAVARIAAAYANRHTDVPVEVGGTVVKLLPDDQEGSRHQKLILRISDDMTLLVAHNIDLAPRVPAREGDQVVVAGDYEWNERGGVIHWTHHDPAGRHRDGWIRHAGKIYK